MLNNPYACDDSQLMKAVHCERFRSSGPGGQHAQKTNSAVRLRHKDSDICCQCQDHREYQRNQSQALRELRMRLAMHYRGFGDSSILEARRKGTRLRVSVDAKDFHLLLGYIFDVLTDNGWDSKFTAEICGLSHSQLCKFLCLNKLVMQTVNNRRHDVDLHPLKLR